MCVRACVSNLEDLAPALLRFPVGRLGGVVGAFSAGGLPLVADGHGDGGVEDVVNTIHFLTAALHVGRIHLLGNGAALVRGYGSQALGLEQLDAGSLVAEIGLEAQEDDGSCGQN